MGAYTLFLIKAGMTILIKMAAVNPRFRNKSLHGPNK